MPKLFPTSILSAVIRAYSNAGWECVIKCNLEYTWEHAQKYTSELTRRSTGNVLSVYFGASWQLTSKQIVKEAGRISSSAVGSILDSMLGSVLERASWERDWKFAWEHLEWVWRASWKRHQNILKVSWKHLESVLRASWEHFKSLLRSVQCNRLEVCHPV
jgi:hypothetical protein